MGIWAASMQQTVRASQFFFCDKLQEKYVTAMYYVILSRDERKDGL